VNPLVTIPVAATVLAGGIIGVAEHAGYLDQVDRALAALHLHDPDTAAGPGTSRLPRLRRSGPLTVEIDRATRDQHVRTAMRLGALLEGGRLVGPWPCGDGGQSCGPYQIYRRAHPSVSAAESQNPAFAVAFMVGRYTAACGQISATAWRADPRGAAARCVFRAEAPRRMYPASRVHAAWAALH
jgi:hypothetical protein